MTTYVTQFDPLYGLDPSVEAWLPAPLAATTAGLPAAPQVDDSRALLRARLAAILLALLFGAAGGWVTSAAFSADSGAGEQASAARLSDTGNGDRARAGSLALEEALARAGDPRAEARER